MASTSCNPNPNEEIDSIATRVKIQIASHNICPDFDTVGRWEPPENLLRFKSRKRELRFQNSFRKRNCVVERPWGTACDNIKVHDEVNMTWKEFLADRGLTAFMDYSVPGVHAHVAEFYSNMEYPTWNWDDDVDFVNGNLTILSDPICTSYVRGREIVITKDTFCEVYGLPKYDYVVGWPKNTDLYKEAMECFCGRTPVGGTEVGVNTGVVKNIYYLAFRKILNSKYYPGAKATFFTAPTLIIMQVLRKNYKMDHALEMIEYMMDFVRVHGPFNYPYSGLITHVVCAKLGEDPLGLTYIAPARPFDLGKSESQRGKKRRMDENVQEGGGGAQEGGAGGVGEVGANVGAQGDALVYNIEGLTNEFRLFNFAYKEDAKRMNEEFDANKLMRDAMVLDRVANKKMLEAMERMEKAQENEVENAKKEREMFERERLEDARHRSSSEYYALKNYNLLAIYVKSCNKSMYEEFLDKMEARKEEMKQRRLARRAYRKFEITSAQEEEEEWEKEDAYVESVMQGQVSSSSKKKQVQVVSEEEDDE